MRQNSRPNSENQQLMDDLLHQVTQIFPNSEYGLPFIGSLLYLKKKGANLMGNYSEATFLQKLAEYDVLLSNDSLHDAISDVMTYVANHIPIYQLGSIFNTIAIYEFDDSEYLHLYDYAIENFSFYKNLIEQFVVPKGLTDLAQAFICGKAKKILVPYGGIMNFATEIDGYDKLDSFELNNQTWFIGMLRLELGGIAEQCNFVCNDMLSWSSEQYDAIVSMPQFGKRLNMRSAPATFEANHTEESELVAPCRFIESTTDTGICVAFAPTSLLMGDSAKRKFRVWAMENGILDTIILLPSNMLNETNIQLACVILRKKPFHENAVRMIDASGFYINHQGRNLLDIGQVMSAFHSDTENVSRTVTYDEISNLDYSWFVREYLQEAEECPEGYTMKALEEIVETPRLRLSTTRDKGLVVKVSDLSSDWTHPYIDIANLSEENNLHYYSRLDKTAILLSTVRVLKPSIIHATEKKPVWLNSNVMAIIPNDVIDPEFLCMTLGKMDVPTIGYGAPYISKTYVLRMKIAVPDLSIQKTLYKQASQEHVLSKAQEIGLQEVIDQMKADYINEVRARKHDMKTPMTQLRNSLTLIKEFVNELPDEFASQLNKYVKRQQKALDVLSEIVSHIADEDVFATPEVFDIESLLKSFETATDKYIIEYHRDSVSLKEAGIETPYISIGKIDFVRLVQNIVSNAVKRGFVKDNTEYALHITLSVENDFYVIHFTNNGEPLPDGMDKVRYGTKGAKGVNSDGSGTGGYIVKSITQHYGGDFDIYSTRFANIDYTHVIVKLPIYRKEDE